ncbi:SDR family oxidoreductase [Nocardiopsis sp. HNM0947]|uniref:SDR family oxidoreductase n=1 Tax=Nocardiopsis coralli TaxID=2772213 RepID=A0ABR9P3W9_9ACTN|nr:SDR family oxidoreductase [Nocardiopsis coralli]MBE2998529.1 SDR family oxidoreductase [Nocardiopsis coralli]
MLLEGKVAVVFGGSGAIGGAVARTFAREGARVIVAGRTREKVERVVDDIGPQATGTLVDALDEASVEAVADLALETYGAYDVSLTAVGLDNGDQGIPITELGAEAFLRPVREYTTAHYLTARAAVRRMTDRGGGVILPVSAPMARIGTPYTGPFASAHAAVETMALQVAGEAGEHGVRVVALRPNGMPDSVTEHGSHVQEIWGRIAERSGIALEDVLPEVAAGGFTDHTMSVQDVAELAAWTASDRAVAITGTVINATGGAVPD